MAMKDGAASTFRKRTASVSFLCLLIAAGPAFGQDLRIITLSVGQTDSQLVIGPSRTLLIDCGAEVAGSTRLTYARGCWHRLLQKSSRLALKGLKAVADVHCSLNRG